METQKSASTNLEHAKQLSGKEHMLEEKQKLFIERENLIIEKDKLISQKDQNIAKLDAHIKDLQAKLIQVQNKGGGQSAKRETELTAKVAELQKQCQALTDDMTRAEKAN